MPHISKQGLTVVQAPVVMLCRMVLFSAVFSRRCLEQGVEFFYRHSFIIYGHCLFYFGPETRVYGLCHDLLASLFVVHHVFGILAEHVVGQTGHAVLSKLVLGYGFGQFQSVFTSHFHFELLGYCLAFELPYQVGTDTLVFCFDIVIVQFLVLLLEIVFQYCVGQLDLAYGVDNGFLAVDSEAVVRVCFQLLGCLPGIPRRCERCPCRTRCRRIPGRPQPV